MLSETRNTEVYSLSDFRIVKDDNGNLGIRAIGEFPILVLNGEYYWEKPIFVPYSEDWLKELKNEYEASLYDALRKLDDNDLEDLADFTDDDWDNGDEPAWDISKIECISNGIEAEVDFMIPRLREGDCVENFTDPSEGKYYYEYRLYSFPKISVTVDYGII